MTNQETLELALNALKCLFGLPDKFTGEGGDVAVWRLGGSYRAQEAIKALEEALAKQEQGESKRKWQGQIDNDEFFESLEQEQCEPFGWYDMEHGEIRDVEWNRLKPTYEGVWRPLYTKPQQRTWVGLTEQEQGAIMESLNAYGTNLYHFAHAIEAKLKEKNT